MFSVTLAIVILLLCCFTVSAADPAVSVSISKFDSASNSYIETVTAYADDLLLVTISVDKAISKLACLNLKLNYNGNVVSYVKNSATSHIVADNPKAGSPIYIDNFNDKNPEISFIQSYIGADSYNKQELASSVSGKLLTFVFSCNGSEGQAQFSVSITEIYDSTYHTIKLSNTTTSSQVTISKWALSESDKKAFEKLLNITYPDSKEDIEAADSIVSSFTSAQLKKFKSGYPDLFATYNNAWNKYYDLSQDALLSSVKAEISEFLSKNSAALKLTADKVNSSNYKKVLDMYKSYSNLSDPAKTNMDAATKKKITALNEAAKAVKKSVEAKQLANDLAKEFINNAMYKVLWDMDEQGIKDSILEEESRLALIERLSAAKTELEDLALDNLSAKNKKKINELKKRLDYISSYIEVAIKDNEKALAIQAEIDAFNKQWSDVFGITMFNVKVTDKSAIELMLKAYEDLSEDAKKALASRKQTALSLIELIDGLLEADNSQTENMKEPETQIQTQIQTQTEIQTQTVEKVVEKEVLVEGEEKVVKSVRTTPLFVKIMVLLALISMLLMFVPIIIYCIKSEKIKAFLGKGEGLDD